MSSTYANAIDLTAGGFMLAGVMIVWRRELRSLVRLLAWQGAALAAFPFVEGIHQHDGALVAVGIAIASLRVGLLPWLLRRAVGAEAEDRRESTPLLNTTASLLVAGLPGAEQLCPAGPLQPAQRVRVPGVATALRAIMTEGRDGFYRGEFGRALLDLGRGLFVADDLERDNASWVEPLRSRAWGHDLWTVPAPSQGYLALAGAVIAEQVGLPTDTEDPEWAHLLVEAARAAGHDRPRDLHEDADGAYLLDERRLTEAAARIDPARVAPSDVAGDDRGGDGPTSGVPRLGDGDTTHLCAIDGDRLGISLTESNALDFGAHLVAGSTGIFLHNRGLGFSLQPGHPAELRAGRRPPHTLSPSLVTNPAGSLTQLVGTMGGDGQPQIILQLFARLLHSREDPAAAIAAARFVLDARDAGPFRLWHGRELSVRLEAHAPAGWTEGLRERGHEVRSVRALDPVAVGCAQIVSLEADETVTRADRTGAISGASDPRSPEGAAVAY